MCPDRSDSVLRKFYQACHLVCDDGSREGSSSLDPFSQGILGRAPGRAAPILGLLPWGETSGGTSDRQADRQTDRQTRSQLRMNQFHNLCYSYACFSVKYTVSGRELNLIQYIFFVFSVVSAKLRSAEKSLNLFCAGVISAVRSSLEQQPAG